MILRKGLKKVWKRFEKVIYFLLINRKFYSVFTYCFRWYKKLLLITQVCSVNLLINECTVLHFRVLEACSVLPWWVWYPTSILLPLTPPKACVVVRQCVRLSAFVVVCSVRPLGPWLPSLSTALSLCVRSLCRGCVGLSGAARETLTLVRLCRDK